MSVLASISVDDRIRLEGEWERFEALIADLDALCLASHEDLPWLRDRIAELGTLGERLEAFSARLSKIPNADAWFAHARTRIDALHRHLESDFFRNWSGEHLSLRVAMTLLADRAPLATGRVVQGGRRFGDTDWRLETHRLVVGIGAAQFELPLSTTLDVAVRHYDRIAVRGLDPATHETKELILNVRDARWLVGLIELWSSIHPSLREATARREDPVLTPATHENKTGVMIASGIGVCFVADDAAAAAQRIISGPHGHGRLTSVELLRTLARLDDSALKNLLWRFRKVSGCVFAAAEGLVHRHTGESVEIQTKTGPIRFAKLPQPNGAAKLEAWFGAAPIVPPVSMRW